MRDEHILAALFSEPWAILPEKLRAIQEVALRHARSERLEADAIAAITAAAARPATPPVQGGAVAVVPVVGVMAQRMSLLSEMSGGTSTARIGQALKQALNDPAVGSIVLDIDSPGGSVFGTPELADLIYAARGQKPIVAVANSMAASAAYYVASQADEIVVAPGGQVGSIGVYAAHVDESRALDAQGVSVTLISAGQYKVEGNPTEPLGDEARQYMQSQVNAYYDMFVKAVARGRGASPAVVRDDYGQGRMVMAADAVRLGMADRVATLDETITRLVSGRRRPAAARAQALALRAEQARALTGPSRG